MWGLYTKKKKKMKANIIEIALKHLASACVPSIILKIEQVLGTRSMV